MKRAFVMLFAPVAALVLAACGSNTDSGSTSSPSNGPSSTSATAAATQHNNQDIAFAQGMIPHHQQAIEMAKLAKTRASQPEVKQLATAIEGAQAPEIQQMTGWLKAWGAKVPSGDMGGMAGMDHGMGDGMMSGKEMKALENLSGKRFDTRFLTMMIEHHQGAVTMARTEQAAGQATEAKTLAGNVITTQTAEIAKMRRLLKNR